MMENLAGHVFGNEILDTTPKEWFKKEKIKLSWAFVELKLYSMKDVLIRMKWCAMTQNIFKYMWKGLLSKQSLKSDNGKKIKNRQWVTIRYICINWCLTQYRYRCLHISILTDVCIFIRASLVAQTVKRLPATRETQVRFLGWEDPLEKEMAIHSSTLAWKISWTEEPDRLQSMGSQRVGHDWATLVYMHEGLSRWC